MDQARRARGSDHRRRSRRVGAHDLSHALLHGIGRSSADSRNAGSACRVTAVTTPSAPSPTRAALSTSAFSSGEQLSTEPGELRLQGDVIIIVRNRDGLL